MRLLRSRLAAAAGIEAVRLVRAACRPADEGECGRWARGG